MNALRRAVALCVAVWVVLVPADDVVADAADPAARRLDAFVHLPEAAPSGPPCQ